MSDANNMFHFSYNFQHLNGDYKPKNEDKSVGDEGTYPPVSTNFEKIKKYGV